MYLHIGKECIIKNKDIIGIFNIDYIKNTKEYKGMYNSLEEQNSIINVSDMKDKTFILAQNNKKNKGYITNIGVNTISKRLI
jgi:predicted regulator of amino acid metabolism with ACT domain